MLKLYNTLTKNKEEFKTVDGTNKVRMYTCGPTVYTHAHIGNFRAYLFMDTIRRVLLYNDYELETVMNITDVGHLTDDSDDGDDKIEQAAKNENKTPEEISNFYTEIFFNDYKKLNILDVEKVTKATDNIKDMISFIKTLLDAEMAYLNNGSVYFDVDKYDKKYSYGKLNPEAFKGNVAGARVEVDKGKKNPLDFALWIKAPKNHIMKWDSPWGMGYPGWHIECSTMSKKYLGDKFDIHTGGVDHAALHHENEIAQSQGVTGDVQANFWMHCEFLKVDGGKMSKSLGNTYTISDLEDKGYNAIDFRYFILNANFRKTQNFTFDALDSAKKSLNNMIDLLHERMNEGNETSNVDEYDKRFKESINNDLNVPDALAVVWEMLKNEKGYHVYEKIIEFDDVLGLGLDELVRKRKENIKSVHIPDEIKALAKKRWDYKVQKDFEKSDNIRKILSDKGYYIKDKKDSYDIIKIDND